MATNAQFLSFGPYFSSSGDLYLLKVYHYSSGTTTLKDGYTTRAKGATIAQPLASDDAGVASAYWDGLYKFRIDGSTDGVNYTTLYTNDNVAVVDQIASTLGEGAALTAASTLTLGDDGNFFHVTGSTTINAISGAQSKVTLVFDAIPTLTYSGNILLQGGVSYTARINDVIEFVNDGGGVWRETSRTTAAIATYPTQGTSVASTSGTSIAFANTFPADVRRFTVTFTGVSTNGTDSLLIQIGGAGGIESSGYLGASNITVNGGATVGATSTAGLLISSASASNIIHGAAVFDRVDRATFAWVGRGIFATSNAASTIVSACSKSLSSALIQVSITTTGGTNTFDAGSINVTFE